MAAASLLGAGPSGGDDAGSVAARLGARVLHLVVEATSQPVPSVQQLDLLAASDDLADFEPRPGQDLMVDVGDGSSRPLRRRYTIRSFTPQSGQLSLQVVLHGDGPGVRWARSARAATTVTAIGPRGKIWPLEAAPWHGFVGDEAFLPAASAMIEGRPAGTAAWALIEVDGPEDELTPNDPTTPVTFLHRGDRPRGGDAGLLAALSDLQLPPGRGQLYVGGELGVVAAIRRHLLDSGLADDQISSKPYWRRGRPNQAHGEPEKG
jgi:NADPH-dependent ferric siderophore reductase